MHPIVVKGIFKRIWGYRFWRLHLGTWGRLALGSLPYPPSLRQCFSVRVCAGWFLSYWKDSEFDDRQCSSETIFVGGCCCCWCIDGTDIAFLHPGPRICHLGVGWATGRTLISPHFLNSTEKLRLYRPLTLCFRGSVAPDLATVVVLLTLTYGVSSAFGIPEDIGI